MRLCINGQGQLEQSARLTLRVRFNLGFLAVMKKSISKQATKIPFEPNLAMSG